ncbi:MAG: hypothetical protein ACTHKG_03420 [Nocardioides sp.]
MARPLGSRSLSALLVTAGLTAASLAGCTSPADEPAASDGSVPSSRATAKAPSGSPSPAAAGEVVAKKDALDTALAMVPASASAAVFTDLDAVRERLGYADLTSASPHADRTAFAEEAPGKAVLLTDGRLTEDASELELDYGFTEADVDWELSFTGPDGTSGWVLGFRPDQDMAAVERAVSDGAGPFGDQDVVIEGNVVSSGAASGDTWADDEDLMATVGKPQETLYLHAGPPPCLPLTDVLGPDAGAEEQQDVLARYDIGGLFDFEAFSLGFTGDHALATMSYAKRRGSIDAELRSELTYDWPAVDGLAFSDGFGEAVEGSSRRLHRDLALIDLPVVDTRAAARLTLTDLLPFAVCSDTNLVPEPSG